MSDKIMKLFMPVVKQADGKFLGILSDTSIDRDNEMMSAGLLREWARENKVLPALVNHENKMQSLVGGWKNLRVVEKEGRTALVAEPFFFSRDANPLAYQVKMQVEEALANGLNVGISIGARALDSETVVIDDRAMRQYTKAEIVESSFVPVQSNPNASFGAMAKKYDINVDGVQKGVKKMSEEMKQEVGPENTEEAVVEASAPAQEEVAQEEAQAESEAVEESAEAEAEPSQAEAELEQQKSVIADLQKQVADLEKKLFESESKTVMKATVETGVSEIKKSTDVETSLNYMFKIVGKQ